jgi:histidyl-tRNA synthetase
MAITEPARGTRENPATDLRKCNYVTETISDVCAGYGLLPVEGTETFRAKIAVEGKSVEANAILAMNEALERLGIKNFAIYLSHSEVLANILETVRVPEDIQPKTFAAIRSFTKFDIEGFVSDLQEVGVSEKASTVLADLFLNTDEVLNQEHDVNQTIVSNLLNIVNHETLTELGQILRMTGRKPVLIDPALPCESPFDAGIVIEARTSGLEILGSGGCINAADDSVDFAFAFVIENIIELMESSNAFAAKNN